MNKRRRSAQIALISIVILGILVCPLSIGARAGTPLPQIEFTPHVTPVPITPTPPFSGLGPMEGGPVRVEGGFLRVGNASSPIGCEFQGGALIPTGSTTQSATGLFGYSTIEGAPEYRLIWYTGPGTWFARGGGERRYMIIGADDPLFSGTPNVQTGDGFEDYLGQVLDTEHDMGFGAGGFVTGAVAAVFAQLYACAGTGGLTCASAALTAVVGIVGGGFATLLNLA